MVKNKTDAARCLGALLEISRAAYAICTSVNTWRFSTGGSSTHKTSSGARKRSSWRFSDIERCPAAHRTVPGRSPLKSYDFNLKPKSPGALPMQTPAKSRPGSLHFTHNDHTKRRISAVEFTVVHKLLRAQYDVLKQAP